MGCVRRGTGLGLWALTVALAVASAAHAQDTPPAPAQGTPGDEDEFYRASERPKDAVPGEPEATPKPPPWLWGSLMAGANSAIGASEFPEQGKPEDRGSIGALLDIRLSAADAPLVCFAGVLAGRDTLTFQDHQQPAGIFVDEEVELTLLRIGGRIGLEILLRDWPDPLLAVAAGYVDETYEYRRDESSIPLVRIERRARTRYGYVELQIGHRGWVGNVVLGFEISFALVGASRAITGVGRLQLQLGVAL